MDQLAAAGGRREPVSSYGKREYWQQRYAANSAPLEWFVSLADVLHDVPTLAQLLSNRAGKRARVLELGCGTSSLAAELWDLGFRDVVAVDYDEQAIAAQRARQQPTQRHVDYRVMDCLDLTFEAAAFDLVIDKGTVDALICAGTAAQGAAQVWRVLKPDGVAVVMSNSPLMEVPQAFGKHFDGQDPVVVRNVAKVYLYARRKKPK